MGQHPFTCRRSLFVALALALFVTACGTGGGGSGWDVGGAQRPWYCDPTDTAINDMHMGHTGPMHYTEEKGPLSASDCFMLNYQLNDAVQYASQFPTKGVAEANGWHWLAPWIPGQGTHHVNIARNVTDQFDPKRPNMLMYDSNDASGRLTGMVWVVRSGMMPPAGFAGLNDHWHFHEVLCYTYNPLPFIVGDNITDEQCANLGGTNVDGSDTWLLHVWLPEYAGWQATDIFNRTHPGIT